MYEYKYRGKQVSTKVYDCKYKSVRVQVLKCTTVSTKVYEYKYNKQR